MNLVRIQRAAGALAKINQEGIIYVGAVNLICLILLYIPTSKQSTTEFVHKELSRMDPLMEWQ